MKTVFEILGEAQKERGFQLLLIGGFALQKYGVSRQTFDVDCLLADSRKGQLDDLLLDAGYVVEASTDNFVRYTSSNVYHMDVDVLLVDDATFGKMMDESMPYAIDAIELPVPSLVHLIALKIHAVANNARREAKDILDISALIQENPDEVSKQKLKQLCDKYGTEEIAQKLEDLL